MMRPVCGSTDPPIVFTSDDLPAPLGPTRPTTSPWLTCRLTPSTARNGPYRTVMPESSSIDAAEIVFHHALVGQDVARRAVGDLPAGQKHDESIAGAPPRDILADKRVVGRRRSSRRPAARRRGRQARG